MDTLWNEIHRMFSSLTHKLEVMLESYVTSLDDRIGRLQQHMDALKKDCNASVDNLTRTVNDACSANWDKLEKLDRVEKAQDLVITGIPYHRDEDLHYIYRSIARSIGAGEISESMVHLRRLYKHPLRPGISPPILCQFAFRGLRNEFFNKYLITRSLALHHIGLGGHGRVYVNERLSPITRRILKAVIGLRNEGSLYKVFTRNGLVSVVSHKTNETIAVNSLDKLMLLKSYLSK